MSYQLVNFCRDLMRHQFKNFIIVNSSIYPPYDFIAKENQTLVKSRDNIHVLKKIENSSTFLILDRVNIDYASTKNYFMLEEYVIDLGSMDQHIKVSELDNIRWISVEHIYNNFCFSDSNFLRLKIHCQLIEHDSRVCRLSQNSIILVLRMVNLWNITGNNELLLRFCVDQGLKKWITSNNHKLKAFALNNLLDESETAAIFVNNWNKLDIGAIDTDVLSSIQLASDLDVHKSAIITEILTPSNLPSL